MKTYAEYSDMPAQKAAKLKKTDCRLKGYAEKLVLFPEQNQLTDTENWKLFVNQFREQTDAETGGWRGEFWGKTMRAGCMTYSVTKNNKLYKALADSVKDLLSCQDKDGRISTYSREREFFGWDMWCRKYVMLGLEYFYDICKSDALKRKIARALIKHADYIVKRVGKGNSKIEIIDTSAFWGGMNSCSILEPFVKLYNIAALPRHLKFAKYIVKTGFCKDFNLIEACLKKDITPHLFPHTKAYEMMSCFEGLLEYYFVVREEKYLRATVNFADAVAEKETTLIGAAGCAEEQFNHSAFKQTEKEKEVMQETCVTVTLMKLNYRLLCATGESRFAERIETSALNAMAGAVNTEHQDMHLAKAGVWEDGKLVFDKHEPFPFDSYSPLCSDRRAKLIGGYMRMQGDRSYGCCACIGGAGTAIIGLFPVLAGKDALFINLYNGATVKAEVGGFPVTLSISANLYRSSDVKIKVTATKNLKLGLRIPSWAASFSVWTQNSPLAFENENGYAIIKTPSPECIITVKLENDIKLHRLNGKIALTKGPFVLARTSEFKEDVSLPVKISADKNNFVRARLINKPPFDCNIALSVSTDDGLISLCDYAQAGKLYDGKDCDVTVWMPEK